MIKIFKYLQLTFIYLLLGHLALSSTFRWLATFFKFWCVTTNLPFYYLKTASLSLMFKPFGTSVWKCLIYLPILVWFHLVSWHINHCRLMPNLVYSNILDMMSILKLTKLNSCKYCYVSLTILSNISHLFTHSSIIKQFFF